MAGKLRIPRAKPMSVFVGVKAGATYPNGTSVAYVAKCLEYGTHNAADSEAVAAAEPDADTREQHIPPRPFLHTSYKTIIGWDLGGLFAAGGPELVGKLAAEQIQRTILSWATPGNASSTIKRKGVDAPLRETMLLSRSITHWTPEDNE